MTVEILNYIPKQLIKEKTAKDTVAPSFYEIQRLAIIDGAQLRVIVVSDEDEVIGCSVSYIEQKKYHGLNLKVYSLFGYLVHDYGRILCRDQKTLNLIKNEAIKDARNQKCDLISWCNIPFKLLSKCNVSLSTSIKIFDAEQNSQGWGRFYKSKHVKYSKNRATKIGGDYRIEIIDGYLPDDIMEELAKFHILRWKFAGFDSPFLTNKLRKDEYRVNPENKHFLRIYSGDELIGCHYGMIYGDTLLFHTPIINPKYLEISPMKLILAETAKYCEAKGLKYIDFGHGDEAYKEGYCSIERKTWNYEKVISIKGQISYLIGKVLTPLNRQFNIIFSKNIFKKKQKKLKYYNSEQEFQFQHSNKNINSKVLVFRNWEHLYDFGISNNLTLTKDLFNNFHKNRDSHFICLIEDGNILQSGWLKDKN